jgi:uncharacterized protein with PIN domain
MSFGRRRPILVAIALNETPGLWCVKQHEDPAAELMMSTVNCAGVLILSSERQPQMASQLREQISALPIRCAAPSVQQAEIAAEARLKFPLHPGDCFAYALA